MTILYVRWLDSGAHVDHGWKSSAEYTARAHAEAMTVESVGFLMDETDEVLALGATHDAAGGLWNGGQLIYKANIVERRELA